MKKYLHIPIAILLIAIGIWGCSTRRARPILTCFPSAEFTSVSASRVFPGEGFGTDLAVTPEQLFEAMDGATVRPRSSFMGWTSETIFMHVFAGGEGFYVEIGEDGNIIIAELSNLDESKTYWRAVDSELYDTLLSLNAP